MDKWLEAFARANFRRSGDTAHDLKTPLNVAVLNLELLRMRLAKLGDAATDEKIAAYTTAIEGELRRLARIFDTFFLLSTPPKDEGKPVELDITSLAKEAATTAGIAPRSEPSATVVAHESRMRQALRMFFEGASKILQADSRDLDIRLIEDRFEMMLSGKPQEAELELTKNFKFYYTDESGSPDLSLASARLIIETYGGELNALEERDKVMLRLSIPLGDQ